MNNIYLIRLGSGDYNQFSQWVHFATFSEDVAKRYAEKYNRILKKWQDYYKDQATEDYKINGHAGKIYQKWAELMEWHECDYYEVPVR